MQLISQEPQIIWLSFMVHLCKMMISLGSFFHFFKILVLLVVKGGGIEGQKMVQNEKKFCLLRSISQESYIIWFWFMVLMCKKIISLRVFHFFKILISGLLGGKRAKNSLKWHKKLYVALDISGTIHHMIVVCGTHL